MNFILIFLKGFVIKHITTVALEKMLIIFIKDLVKRTDSKIDDEIFEVVFEKCD